MSDDPVADFLSRESEQMAELGDESLMGLGNQDADMNNFNEPGFNGFSDDQQLAPDGNDFDGEQQLEQEEFDQEQEASDAYAAIKTVDTARAEAPCIQQWRAEFEANVAAKDEAEAQAIGEWREAASHEMETWQKNYGQQLEASRSANRETQDAYIRERDETAPGGEWERVAKLCDLSPKGGKQGGKDVSRMRGMLLRLKTEPLVR